MKKHRKSLKSELWASYYFDPRSPTFFNATKSALLAYHYDPITQYNLASVTGHKNIKKYKIFAAIELEKQGMTLPVLMKKLYDAAINEGYFKIKDFMSLLGYTRQ